MEVTTMLCELHYHCGKFITTCTNIEGPIENAAKVFKIIILFTGGIMQHHCNNEHLDHTVQVIGYDFITSMYYICNINTKYLIF